MMSKSFNKPFRGLFEHKQLSEKLLCRKISRRFCLHPKNSMNVFVTRKFIFAFGFLLFLSVSFLQIAGAQTVIGSGAFSGSQRGTASYVNYGSSFTRYYGSELNTYWPVLNNRDTCEARQDILVQISPLGCQPAVVRSDLLAEQNVPVFCQLDLLQINPAIDVKQIRSLRFNGRYPSYVSGVGFHPAQAALRTRDRLLGS